MARPVVLNGASKAADSNQSASFMLKLRPFGGILCVVVDSEQLDNPLTTHSGSGTSLLLGFSLSILV